MNQPLWQPTEARIKESNLLRFIRQLDAQPELGLEDYETLHRWSVENPELFWAQVWRFAGVRASQPWEQVLVDGDRFPGARWFPGARLNFAENLLRSRDERPALVACLENGSRRILTHAELYSQVARLAAALRKSGVAPGDRVAGFMPNVPETLIAMLASASIGAVWSSCSPDFGLNGVLDRLGQIQPKVLFACDGYYYNGKTIDCLERVADIAARIESLEKVVLVSVAGIEGNIGSIQGAVLYDAYLLPNPAPEIEFEQLPFDHPLYILYSSGTTGPPKCIVHSAGGTLLQHLKEHQLHVDLKPGDVLFFYTTCGWMMWNWLMSGLASGATLVLYDGSPFYPDANAMLNLVDRERVTVFGTSPKFISEIEKAQCRPCETHDLGALRSVLTTGSPLSPENFRYVYRDIKADVCLSSISGGTDIVSCFVLGNTCLPVWEGEIQCIGLGMAVEIWNEAGKPVREEKGEMVCTLPFPNAPIGFWNDPDQERYRSAYFEQYPNVWAHGDYGEITAHGGVIIHGRSDAVLNPGGVRIGTAEIYRQVDKLEEVSDSVCIGQEWQDDVRVVLFVMLHEGVELTEELQQKIRRTIREETTPRHVPAKIVAVADIPRTLSGKIVELAVRSEVHGNPVKNSDALANPESLVLFRDLPELRD